MKRAFEVKQKAVFIIFKGLSVAKNCLRAESASLKNTWLFILADIINVIKPFKMILNSNSWFKT